MSLSEKVKKQKRAHDKKRANLPTFPKQYITDEYSNKISELVAIYGTKKNVLLHAIDCLYKEKQKVANSNN